MHTTTRPARKPLPVDKRRWWSESGIWPMSSVAWTKELERRERLSRAERIREGIEAPKQETEDE